jgi:CPA2 family monovalent cation:H+ antiporter-2
MSSLEIALIFLAAAVCTVVAFRLMHLPAVLGYLTAGIVISPFAFSVAKQAASLSYLAEFGVVFLNLPLFDAPLSLRIMRLS